MQKVGRHLLGTPLSAIEQMIEKVQQASSDCLEALGFRCFKRLLRLFFSIPSRYLYTIGQSRILRLGGWSPHFQTRFFLALLNDFLTPKFQVFY